MNGHVLELDWTTCACVQEFIALVCSGTATELALMQEEPLFDCVQHSQERYPSSASLYHGNVSFDISKALAQSIAYDFGDCIPAEWPYMHWRGMARLR